MPLPGLKPKILSGLTGFRSPALAEREDTRVLLAAGTIDEMRQPVAEIVVRSRQIRRQGPHVQMVEEIAANEVECKTARLLGNGREALLERHQTVCHDMSKVFGDEKQQLRRARLRLYVDGDAIVRIAAPDADLEMRRGRSVLASSVDDAAHQYAIMSERHGAPDELLRGSALTTHAVPALEI